jgi:hypothetical protein
LLDDLCNHWNYVGLPYLSDQCKGFGVWMWPHGELITTLNLE